MVSLEKPIHYKYFFEGRNKSCCWEASKLAGKQFKANVSRLWSDSMFCACALPADFCLYLFASMIEIKKTVGLPLPEPLLVKKQGSIATGSQVAMPQVSGPGCPSRRFIAHLPCSHTHPYKSWGVRWPQGSSRSSPHTRPAV